jgi:hypothetical protein
MSTKKKAARKAKKPEAAEVAVGGISPFREEIAREQGTPIPITPPEPPPPPPPPPVDPEPPPPAAKESGEVDPIRIDGKEEIPIYNPNEAPVSWQYGGLFWTVRGKGIDVVPLEAANYAVGEDNTGGRLSGVGLRRLYCDEPRFREFAAKACMPWYEWIEKRNAVVKKMAESVASGNPHIEELKKIEIPKYVDTQKY